MEDHRSADKEQREDITLNIQNVLGEVDTAGETSQVHIFKVMRQGTKTKSKTGSKNDEQRNKDTVNLTKEN